MGLSVTLATRNEERCILRCLEAVNWADEIVVVDDMSTDLTAEICRSHGARVILNDSNGSFHENKNLAIDEAHGDWILSLDADEFIPPALAEEIRSVIVDSGPGILGYEIDRHNMFLGKRIRGCGWSPNYLIRLFRKGSTEWPIDIHDVPSITDSKRVGRLKNGFVHDSYYSLEQYLTKLQRYTTRLAQEACQRGERVSAWNIPFIFLVRPMFWFIRKYFLQLGIRDGFRGFFIATGSAITIVISYAKLWEIQNFAESAAEGANAGQSK